MGREIPASDERCSPHLTWFPFPPVWISRLLSCLVSLSFPCWNLNINIQVSLMKTLGPFSDSVCSSIYFSLSSFHTKKKEEKTMHSQPPGSSRSTHAWVLLSNSVVSDSLWPRGLQHPRLPCPWLPPGVCLNSSPLSRWCHPTMSSCHPLLLPSIFPSIRVFFSKSALHIRWPEYWSFSISPSNCLVLYKCAHIIGILL